MAESKIIDRSFMVSRKRGDGTLRYEVWQDNGVVARYNLAYINFLVCQEDNGRVLGYDNSHDDHHSHFMGTVAPYKFQTYESLAADFHQEVAELWSKEDEENA